MAARRSSGSATTFAGTILRAIRALPRPHRPVVVGLVTAGLAATVSVAALAPPAGPAPGVPARPPPLVRLESPRPSTIAVGDGASSQILSSGASTILSSSIGDPAGAGTGAPVPSPDLSPRESAFTLDLYRRGDFVSQGRTDWCVPAAIQTMARLIDRLARPSLPSQDALDRRARALSSSRLVGLGSEPQGWAGVLNDLGFGPYVVVAKSSFADAITVAAEALRLTGRPVGLLVWHGAHAWVMSGFEATRDPAGPGRFDVTAVRVSDPWYPRRATAWGRSRPPDARVGLAALARSFLPWRRPTVRYSELDARYVLVLPVSTSSQESPQ